LNSFFIILKDEEAAKTSPDREAARAELLAAKTLSTWTEKKGKLRVIILFLPKMCKKEALNNV
jgi:hypothetical protein